MHQYPDHFTDTDDGLCVNGWYSKDFSQMCSLKSIKCQSLYRPQDIDNEIQFRLGDSMVMMVTEEESHCFLKWR